MKQDPIPNPQSLNPFPFLNLPPCPLDEANVVVLPLPLEKTVSYGTGTWQGARAILAASGQIELFDEETRIDFAQGPKIHTLRRCRSKAIWKTAWLKRNARRPNIATSFS